MKHKTIVDTFNISELPGWAQREEDVVWLCRINLGYRRQVINNCHSRDFFIRKATTSRRCFSRRNPLSTFDGGIQS